MVDTVIYDTAQGALYPPDQYNYVPTIPTLFDYIQDAISKKAERFSVIYNEVYGYPEKIDLDYRKGVADDEFNYTIAKFIPR
jgi:hypothetical protein